MKRRKVCFIITSFIHYSRNLLVLEELKNRDDIDLHVVVAGTALLSKYSSYKAFVRTMLEADGFNRIYEVHFNLEGDKAVIKAKTTGLGMIEIASLYNQINPDIVVVRGDRFEVLAAATSAALMNIPVAHIEGGDSTGTIDESIRHAITKLTHVHFATNEAAMKRIIRMGENPEYVFNFGSPDIEVVAKFSKEKYEGFDINSTGSGAPIDANKKFVMVSYHPVTSELDELSANTRTLLETIHEMNIPAVWFWPNFDAGAEEKISHELRQFNDKIKDHRIRFLRYLPPKHYLSLLNTSACLIGNSSAGIKECSFLGVPVVNIGTRQTRRLRGGNVIDVDHSKESLRKGIEKQLANGRYQTSPLYHHEHTGKRIAEKLATLPLYVQKNFHD